MTTVASAKRAMFVLLIANLLLVLFVFRPLGIALFLATVFAGALWPAQVRLTRLLRGSPRLAAALLMLAVILLILGPLVTLAAFMIREITDGVRFVSDTIRSDGVTGLLAHLPDRLEGLARKAMERLPQQGADLDSAVQQQVSARGGKAAAAVGAVLAGTGALLFQAAMMLIALFFFLTEKEKIMGFIEHASPLAAGQTRELLTEFRRVSVAVLRGTVLTAGVQALAALAGYYIARVPYPLFFGAVTFVVAMIPAIGGAAVCIFAAALLLVTGHPWAALFLTSWGVIVVGLSDNVVKPLFIRHGVELHGALVFFALLGGLAAFGTVGLLLGPLAVALFVAMLRIYRRDYGRLAEPKLPVPPIQTSPAPTAPTGRLIPQE